MSRMFKSIDRTWNVFVGCSWDCSYCNVRKLVKTRLKHCPRYKDGFRPHLVESELKRTFKPGEFIFVAYMGDIACATPQELEAILKRIKQQPDVRFLLQTKQPALFSILPYSLPPNVYVGTTYETNRDYHLTKAPCPADRIFIFGTLRHRPQFLSIEPIMDFDLTPFVEWIKIIKPDIIEVGADNYHNHLPEPSGDKLQLLLDSLRHICPNVIEKEGLERLKERR